MPHIDDRGIQQTAHPSYHYRLSRCHSSPSSSPSSSGSMSNTSNIPPAPSSTHATRRPTRPFTASAAAPRLHPTSSRECAIGRGTAEICGGTSAGDDHSRRDANVPRRPSDPARRVRRYPRARRRRRAESPHTRDRRSAPSRRTPDLQATLSAPRHRHYRPVAICPSFHPVNLPTHPRTMETQNSKPCTLRRARSWEARRGKAAHLVPGA